MTILRKYFNKIYRSTPGLIAGLIAVKIGFQIIIIRSGLRWLTADDYSRTVISWEWLQNPKIYSGVWLSLHFWLNGIFIALFRDLTISPIIENTLFSSLTLIYLFLIANKLFSRQAAVLSCLIFAVFPFQVWLSTSGMPESVFFFFITAAVYYFIEWVSSPFPPSKGETKYLVLCIIMLNAANLLRYEGWLFSIVFIIFVCVLSFRKRQTGMLRRTGMSFLLSLLSLVSAGWWLVQNWSDHGDAFFFITETTRMFKDIANAGLFQRVVQYPFFIFYIAPLTTAFAISKVYKVLRNNLPGAKNGLIKIFLLFNLTELVLLMVTGIFGSGGTNMVSRYVVMNSILLFPFAAWQLLDLKKYISVSAVSLILLINIVWSFYYQQAYREDTYEVADLTKTLIQRNYFAEEDKIYFETAEGYYDIYPLQVISNSPSKFVSDTIPAYFPPNVPATRKKLSRKQEDERQRLSILELRKFLEEKMVKLCIARSDLLIGKLKKLSYKSEQIGDYNIFYLSENKIKYRRETAKGSREKNIPAGNFSPEIISFDKKFILKDIYVDNINLGLNPQTVTVKWDIADGRILDSLFTADDKFGRYNIEVRLSPPGKDSTVYEAHSPIFSERIVENFFESEEIKNIIILKPFAMLNYTFTKGRFRLTPFESGVYDLQLSVTDKVTKEKLKIYRGDSLFVHTEDGFEEPGLEKERKKKKEENLRSPYYPIGRIIAIFPEVNYNSILRKSKEFSQIMFRNALMLPFLQRYQGDHFLNIVFTYF